jgi:hypothetical protein
MDVDRTQTGSGPTFNNSLGQTLEPLVRTLLTSVAVAFGLLCAGTAPALAAKGVKKKPVNGVHHVHGVVTHVQHHNGRNGAGHIGEITVKTHHNKKKGQPAAAGKKANHTHKFSVGSNTKFVAHNRNQQAQVGFAAVRPGEHVTITAKGQHAEMVGIHVHTKTNAKAITKKKKK